MKRAKLTAGECCILSVFIIIVNRKGNRISKNFNLKTFLTYSLESSTSGELSGLTTIKFVQLDKDSRLKRAKLTAGECRILFVFIIIVNRKGKRISKNYLKNQTFSSRQGSGLTTVTFVQLMSKGSISISYIFDVRTKTVIIYEWHNLY